MFNQDVNSTFVESNEEFLEDKRRLHDYVSDYLHLVQCKKLFRTERLNVMGKMYKGEELQEINISKEEIAQKVASRERCIENPNITDVLALNDQIVFVKGNFYWGFEYPFFGVILQAQNIFLMEAFHKLLQVFLIEGEIYLTTYWNRAESGARGLIIYKLKKGALTQVFTNWSDGT